MNKRKTAILSLCFSLVLCSATCSRQDTINPPNNTQPLSAIQPTSSSTFTPEILPSPTLEFVPTSTPTIIIPTSLPTLLQPEIDQSIAYLVDSNGGCSIPCWWGIIPGETTWQEARQQLEQFNMEISSTGPSDIEIRNQKRIIEYFYVVYYSHDYPRGLGARIAVLDGSEITMIYTSGNSTGSLFHLHNLLERHGEPDEVFIEVNPDVPEDLLTLRLALFYSDISLGIGYDLPASLVDNNIRACPKDEIPKIWMWDPDRRDDFTPEFIQEGMIGYDARNNFLPLKEVSGFSLDEFQQVFKDPYRLVCLETQLEVWE